jgi:hypothetical protein
MMKSTFALLTCFAISAVGCKGNDKEAAAAKSAAAPGSAATVAAAPREGTAAAPPPTVNTVPLRAGESVTDSKVESEWTFPGGTAVATTVDTERNTKLVVWKHDGKRYDVVSAPGFCNEPKLRQVAKGQLVFRCIAMGTDGEDTGSIVDDWLIRWSDAKGYPVRRRHWEGYENDQEPKWAGAPARAKAKASKSSKATHEKPMEVCCCKVPGEPGGEDAAEMVAKAGCIANWKGTCVAESVCAAKEVDHEDSE